MILVFVVSGTKFAIFVPTTAERAPNGKTQPKFLTKIITKPFHDHYMRKYTFNFVAELLNIAMAFHILAVKVNPNPFLLLAFCDIISCCPKALIDFYPLLPAQNFQGCQIAL